MDDSLILSVGGQWLEWAFCTLIVALTAPFIFFSRCLVRAYYVSGINI